MMPQKKDSLLLCLDVQERTLCRLADPVKTLKNVLALVRGAKVLGVPVVSAAINVEKEGPLVEDLQQLVRSMPQFRRNTFSALHHEGLASCLSASGRNTLILAGLESHVGIQQSALSAMMLGYRVHVAANAVGSRSEEDGRLALARLERAGAMIESVQAILLQLLERVDAQESAAVLSILGS